MQVSIFVTDQNEKRLSLTCQDKMVYVNTDIVDSKDHSGDIEYALINIHSDVEYQAFGGIGSAFTDSSAAVWDSMPQNKKDELIKAYFDRENGIGYTFGRLSMASCDFSTEDYTYLPEGDKTLDNFDISHDKKAVFPMVKAAKEYADLTIFASPWSPPAFMKTNNSRIGGYLKKEYYPLWAEYFKKYIDACKQNQIDIWAVTIQNEPRHHQLWESCLYTPKQEAEFLGYLGKVLEGSGVKILCYDHCRERVFERAKAIFESENGKYCDGIANHWYSGDHFGELKALNARYPEKISVASEGCCVIDGKGIKDELDLPFAEQYAHDICGCFNNGLNYYCDWNILLDEQNGPSHNRENRPCSAEAPVYYISQSNQIVYRLSYYYIGHYSKFVKAGAKVISSSSYNDALETVAFKNTDNSIVAVVLNRSEKELPAIIRNEGCLKKFEMAPHSIATVIITEN